ncbi:hypothetical protein LCGC14_1181570 [marine sediment metagenome]|uniref:Uncharacterized protein n=1 Tax=marine sediment metagenome TaxID=412755 RepID=A0A0F9M9Q0_9ZZZZ
MTKVQDELNIIYLYILDLQQLDNDKEGGKLRCQI